MNSRIAHMAVVLVALTTTFPCATMATAMDTAEAGGNIETAALVNKPIEVRDRYDGLMPEVIHDLKQCAPVRQTPDGPGSYSAQWVIDFGIDLQSRGYDDAEEATVRNELYWKAVVALSANDITALLTRLLLLMREGELRRATILLLFCAYDQNRSWDRDGRILGEVANDINRIEAESGRYVQEGIRNWDQGLRSEALELYHAALQVFPKNPWALWEIAYDHLTYDLDPDELSDGRYESRYELIRKIDPHYELAYYQGKITPEKRAAAEALRRKVLPSYAKLWEGEEVLASMKALADGYFEMGEYELAIYAYKYVLFRTYDETFDRAIVARITACLQALNMQRVVPFLDRFLLEIDRMIASDRKRLEAARQQPTET
jgi:tetratricopeptide (TPR) repeat protein